MLSLKKENTDNFTVKELLDHTFYRAFIKTRLCLSVCVFVNYSISTAFNVSLKRVDSAKDNNLKEEEERENVLSSFSSPLRSL